MGGTRRRERASEGGRNRFFPGVVLEAWAFGAKIDNADGVTLPTHQYIPRRPKASQRQKPMGQGCRALGGSTHSKPGRTFFVCLMQPDETLEIEALTTLITAMYEMGPDPATVSTTEHDARLPDDFPIPSRSVLLGSVSRRDSGRTVLHSARKPKKVLDFYLERLLESGWVLEREWQNTESSRLGLWRGPGMSMVQIEAYARRNGEATLQILTTDRPVPVAHADMGRFEIPDIPLAPPGTSGTAGSGWHEGPVLFRDYRFDSDAGPEKLLRAWTTVLREKGWSIIDENARPSLAYAALRGTQDDFDFHGLLTVRAVPETRRRITTLHLERLSDGGP